MGTVGSTTNSPPSFSNGDLGSPNDTVSEQRIHPGTESSTQISMWWLAVPLIFMVSAMVVAMIAFRPNQDASTGQDSPAIGKTAPRLDLVQLSDEPKFGQLQKVAGAKVTLLHFWGTWCGPCRMEYPHLSKLANRLQSSPQFLFVPVSCEGVQGETFDGLWQKTDDYFISEGIESLAFADPRGITRRSAADRLERSRMFYPTSILVGVDGEIVGVWEGYAPDSVDQMGSFIEDLLAQASET
jgi:cytochrome c biogenesis protein CcmG/thiol:disulfide interchange protein DsbE